MSEQVTDDHYRRISERYTEYLSYSGAFVPALAEKMTEMLRLTEDDVLVDLGGGTGIYTAAILDQVELKKPVLLVDFSAEMLDAVPHDLPVEKIHMDALSFASEPVVYDKMLIKETIHHVDDRAKFLQLVFDRVAPGGALLLVHVPPVLDYPLFDAALKRARSWHADPDELEQLMGEAGFKTDRDAVDWEHSMPKQRYFDMVANRYMSVLSTFSEEELEAGLGEMAAAHAGSEVVTYTDHFDYIVGYKT